MTAAGPRPRPQLLLLLAPADHPHRDAVCATLAWVAEAEGVLFECYYGGVASGAHAGGGHPAWHDPADLRGGPPAAGHHLEAFYQLLQRFQVEAACLGPGMFDSALAAAEVPVRSRAGDVSQFYREVFARSTVSWPTTLLVIGDGGSPEDVPLNSYAYPEVVGRRVLAINDGDRGALLALRQGMTLDSLWVPAESRARWSADGVEIPATAGEPSEPTVSSQTAWLAGRWSGWTGGVLLADPELAGRWIPTAVRRRWLPLYGFPQWAVLDRVAPELREVRLVHGRQQHDADFLELSRRGHSLQLIDPGRPPFPVLAEAPASWSEPSTGGDDPSDEALAQWASDGRVLSTMLFWAGMIRELETLYPVTDLLAQSGASVGVILSTESFRYMSELPLRLVNVPREAGGLFPRVELLLASGGAGTFLEAAAPEAEFAASLKDSVADLASRLGTPALVPRGWWAVMDAPLLPHRQPRISRRSDGWPLRVRYEPRPIQPGGGIVAAGAVATRDLRARVRQSPVRELFEPLRPFDRVRPGLPARAVAQAVREAGFEYAFTKSSFGCSPRVFEGIDGLTILNETAGRWDGWSPFVTIGSLRDLRRAERRLLAKGPGWLAGTLDTCLWAFSGPLLSRGGELKQMCDWLARGGDSGHLLNVTPRTVARYAAMLAATERVERVPVA